MPLGCQLSVGEPRGARVSSVSQGSPAEGLLVEGDVVLSLDDEPISDADELVAAIGELDPGERAEIDYEREGIRQSASVTLQAHPSGEDKGYLGVTIRTAFESVNPEDADDVVEPGPTTRPVDIASRVYLLDPLRLKWQDTGIEIPEDLNWISTSTGIYAATDDEPAVLFDLMTEEELEHDGFRGWEPRRLIGSLGSSLLIVVTTDIADQPGFINIAIAGFDPLTGTTLWVSPVLTGFGVPVTAYGSPDGQAFVVVGTDQDSGEEIAVELYEANGTLRTGGGLIELGSPIGWLDDTTLGFRSGDEVISVLDPRTGSTSTLPLPGSLIEAPLAAVGDSKHILAIQGRALLIDDLTTEGEVRLLADDCALGRVGAPGWGT